MYKKYVFLFIILLIVVFVLFILKFYSTEKGSAEIQKEETSISLSDPVEEDEISSVDFTANFEIYTNDTRRIFTSEMYHNLSEEVYIKNPNPNTIIVKKSGITWMDFFNTLPFSLDKDCLITGTKQTFCSNNNQKLRFFINEQENPNALDLIINPGDSLVVEYR